MTDKKSDQFSFDARVARRYNRQRAHPPEVSAQIGAAIASQARPLAGSPARVLELGVGTGRIAWPVLDAGCRVIGMDIADQMLDEVFSTAPDRQRSELPLIRADMHALPLADHTFDAVLAVHVLHLARDWRQVMDEALRVLRPAGVFVQGDDWIDPESVVGSLRDELRRHAVRLKPDLMPPSARAAQRAAFTEQPGGAVQEIVAAEWTTYVSPAERLKSVEERTDAESWILTPDLFDAMLAHLRDYAANIWPDLDEPQPVTRRFILKVSQKER